MNKVIEDLKWLYKTLDKGGKTAEFYEAQKDIILQALAEHDAIINKFAETLKSRLGDAIHPKDFESMRNLIDDVAKEQNNE